MLQLCAASATTTSPAHGRAPGSTAGGILGALSDEFADHATPENERQRLLPAGIRLRTRGPFDNHLASLLDPSPFAQLS